MPTQYIDPNLIFAENAPTQDKPAAFENYDKGMDETRKNDGRPTIKQFNFLQQQNDLKNLYIHENGAALPYKDGIAYEENAVVVKDGVLQQWKGEVWVSAIESELADKADKTYVDTVRDESVRFYQTLAEANADIANLAVNQAVQIGEAVNGGLYYKSSAGATSLTKSAFDPLAQAKGYTNEKTEFWQVQKEIQIKQFDAWSQFAAGFLGSNGKMPLWIWKSGVVGADKFKVNNLETDEHNISGAVIKQLDPFTGFSFAIGGNGKYPIALRNNGTVVIKELESENITKAIQESSPHARFKECTQEWWISPVHTYVDFPYPRVLSGVYSEKGEIVVGEYVIGAGSTKQIVIDSTPNIDDHNAPSLWIKKDRRAIAIWTQHGLTQNLEMKVSDKYGDIRTLEYATRQEIDVGSGVTYTQLHHIESLSNGTQDTFYMLSRVTLNAWNLIRLSIDQETGVVTMLSNQRILSATQQYYCSSVFDEENSVIRIASSYNPAASLNTIHYWEIDINSGDIKDHTNTVRANFVTPENLPISVESVAALVPQSDSTHDRRLHYVRPSPMSPAIAYAEWLLADPDNATYKVISKDDGTWNTRDVANAGKRFGYTANANYISGISFPTPCYRDEVIVSRYDNSKNEGVLERAVLVGSEYVKKESLRVDKNHLLRPINPVDGGDICMYTQLYAYGQTSTFSFVSDIKSIVME